MENLKTIILAVGVYILCAAFLDSRIAIGAALVVAGLS